MGAKCTQFGLWLETVNSFTALDQLCRHLAMASQRLGNIFVVKSTMSVRLLPLPAKNVELRMAVHVLKKEINNVAAQIAEDSNLAASDVFNDTCKHLNGQLKGSLLLLKSGAWAVVPSTDAVISEAHPSRFRVMVKDGAGEAVARDEKWLASNVSAIVKGVLKYDGAQSKGPSDPLCNATRVHVEPVNATPISQLEVTMPDQTVVKTPEEALEMLGLQDELQPWGPWLRASLALVPPMPSMRATAFLGGDSQAIARANKLSTLLLVQESIDSINCWDAATFLCSWTSCPQHTEAVAKCLALPSDAMGAYDAAALRSKLILAVENAVDELDSITLHRASLEMLHAQADGEDGSAGEALKKVLAEDGEYVLGDSNPPTSNYRALDDSLHNLHTRRLPKSFQTTSSQPIIGDNLMIPAYQI
ncbi:MAG: hypothetical protein SGPRY_001267 [Prymnesium sp.]